MSKLNPTFDDLIKNGVEKAVESAEIFPETKTIVLQPQYTEQFSEEVVNGVCNFIQEQTAIATGAGMQIGLDQFGATGNESWTVNMNMGSAEVTANILLREEVGQQTTFGITDTFVDFNRSSDLDAWYKNFEDENKVRCAKLFES